MGGVKREWVTEDEMRIFKPLDIDPTAIFHTLEGLGINKPETFKTVTECLKQCIANEVLK